MKIIVSVLSDQLVPNILFVRQLEESYDKHIFISTSQMENKNKSSIFAGALKLIKDDYKTLIVDPDDPLKIYQTLEKEKWDETAKYLVNITGGTKIMSQIVFSYFQKFNATEIFYKPLNAKTLIQLYPNLKTLTIDKVYELSLEEYLFAHGYTFTASRELTQSITNAEYLYEQICFYGDASKVALIANAQDANYNKKDKPYLTGAWFEEWVYYTIKEALQLSNNQIAYNLKLKSRFSNRNTDSDNEIDVAFIYENNLYLIECKVYNKRQVDFSKISTAIYKISSIGQSMGLKATAWVAICASLGNSKQRMQAINYLCRMTRVNQVFSLKELRNKEEFITTLKKTFI
ncbi:MAG TPA: DUF1887 family CARF protein [Chitinophagaceae bacterium]|nr:DUF1887 family CARF protein [Chitinophagaceae bacterium]